MMDIGELNKSSFTEKVVFETRLNLIILPVSINGKSFRFLFDTGAPNVISPELQSQFQFKKIAKNTTKDSQGNSQKVQYVKIDVIKIGEINFLNTAACVIDFKANPALSCLDLDGIIGSNLMRFCTWRVNYGEKIITITDQPDQLPYSADYEELRFEKDNQHGIKIDFKTPNATIQNLKIDYGSTGYISGPDRVYKVLNERGDLVDQVVQVGFNQSGIFGILKVDTTKIAVLENGKIGAFEIGEIEFSNGGKGLLGTKLLKNYIVTMNWPKGTIGFETAGGVIKLERNKFGFSPTFDNGNVIVKSVIIDSPAHKAGLMPGMVIKSLDDYIFNNIDQFCDFVNAENRFKNDKKVEMNVDINGEIKDLKIEL